MKTLRKRIPSSLSFAAGALVGAIAVFVSLTSAGIGSNVEGSGTRLPRAVRSSAPAAGRSAVEADSTSSPKRDPREPDAPSNETTCDQQLD